MSRRFPFARTCASLWHAHLNHATAEGPLFRTSWFNMSKQSQRKYYAVRSGRQGPQIYSSWEEVHSMVSFHAVTSIAQYLVLDDPIDQSERESFDLMSTTP